jgi:hypothetical protein
MFNRAAAWSVMGTTAAWPLGYVGRDWCSGYVPSYRWDLRGSVALGSDTPLPLPLHQPPPPRLTPEAHLRAQDVSRHTAHTLADLAQELCSALYGTDLRVEEGLAAGGVNEV